MLSSIFIAQQTHLKCINPDTGSLVTKPDSSCGPGSESLSQGSPALVPWPGEAVSPMWWPRLPEAIHESFTTLGMSHRWVSEEILQFKLHKRGILSDSQQPDDSVAHLFRQAANPRMSPSLCHAGWFSCSLGEFHAWIGCLCLKNKNYIKDETWHFMENYCTTSLKSGVDVILQDLWIFLVM